MLISVLPFAVSAETYTSSGTFASADAFTTGNTSIGGSAEMTIPDGMDMTIPTGRTVTVERGATLIVLGTLRVEKGANLIIEGTLAHSERVTVLGNAQVTYRFPNLRTRTLGNFVNGVYAGYSKDGSSYADVSSNVDWSSNLVAGGNFTAPLNSYVYIRTTFKQPVVAASDEENPVTYDNAKLGVYADGIEIPVLQGAHQMQATTAADITFSDWDDAKYLYDYKFYVPSGSGYTVHSATGETSAYGAIGVPAGSDFRFRIEIDGNYDMSRYEIYYWEGYTFDTLSVQDKIENGEAKLITADSDGYYTISDVYSDYVIAATGVVSNDTIQKASSILDILRNAINVIKTFFERLFQTLGLNIGA